MRTTELFRTCSNEHVAAAALASVGGRLQRRVTTRAGRDGVAVGRLVAALLADYDRRASPARRRELESRMQDVDMPLLAGLRHVLETALAGAWDLDAALDRGAALASPVARGWDRAFAPVWAPGAG